MNSWKQSGNVSLWRYTENQRNYPGWHLNADAAGCASLLALLDALATDGPDAFRTVQITPPTRTQLSVPNNQSGRAAWEAPDRLRVSLSGSAADWNFPPQLEPATLMVGADWLAPLREGISGIPHGRGDCSIGNKDHSSLKLWFWW